MRIALPVDRAGQPEEFLLSHRRLGQRAVAVHPGGDDLQAELVPAVAADSRVAAGSAHDVPVWGRAAPAPCEDQ